MIKEITSYIAQETGLVIGQELFAGFAPIDADDCVIVIESGGNGNFWLPDQQTKTIQIISRAKDYYLARDRSLDVYTALHGKSGITLPVITAGETYFVNTMEVLSLPQSLGPDDAGRINISSNYVLRIQDK